MRIDRIRVGAYGPLAELELEALADSDLLVVYGPNEAGKSSLRSFVASMLYGFSPAAREENSATPADGHANGELELELPDGGRVRVERHLRARPTARAWRGDAQEELANRPLAEVAWLDRGTYLALHAIDADELRGLDASTWREIEQRLLGGASPAFLRPAAVAAGELSASADALWRSDRRGKPRSAELSAELAGLREARREALAEAHAHDEAARELTRVRAELAQARHEEARLDGRRDLHDRHAPALRAWQELERLRAEAEELVPGALAARVGSQPGERIETLRSELAERERELDDVRAELEAAQLASRLSERELVLLEHAQTIREAALARARDDGERGQLAVERDRERSRSERTAELAARVLGHPLRPADEAALESVQIADLQAAATRCERAMPAASARVAHVPAPAVAAAVALACVLAALAGAGLGPTMPLAVGALLAALTALALVRARKGTRTMRAALAERSAGGSDLVAALGELRIAESRIAQPDHSLVSDIEQLRALTRERALAAGRLTQLVEAELRATERGAALAAVLGSDDTERLSEELDAAQRHDAQATAASERASELLPRAAAAAERRTGVGERLDELVRLVQSASPSGEEADALERLHAAAARRIAADQRERSLVEGVPELDALLVTAREREQRGEQLLLSDDDHAALVAELREARSRAEQLMLREQELSAELERLGAARTVGDVEGELAAVEDELAGVRRERDRLTLAAAVVRRAEREVRERYAPAWLQAASRYLEAITHGRYTAIAIVETPGGEPVLEVARADQPMPVRVGPPLSRGTLEQIYVAVRLALVDAIDADARLPLFLDELFAHWDSSRLDALVRVLGAVQGRQVIVSTCHAALADRLERSCGARVVELAGPGGILVQRPLRRLAVATAAPEQEGPTLLDLHEG
ncbi:MAG: hypothetical protein QOC86_1936 [Gaiellales bacterium]|nr:hypothetical protein [Gaiellales bacterium]